MPCGKGSRFIQKEQFGPRAGLHDRPPPSFPFELAGNPRFRSPLRDNLSGIIMDDATIS
jgi:hypothetical protein